MPRTELSSMPEIGLSGLLLDYPHSGTAVYTRNLVPLLPQVAPDLDFRLFVRNPLPAPTGVPAQHLTTPLARLNRGTGVGARLDKLAWELVSLPLASAVRREALIHSLYLAAPVAAAAPVVVTIHDVIQQALLDYHRTRQAQIYHALMVRLARRARAIITVSIHSKVDIMKFLGLPESKIHVTYEAADPRFSPQPLPEDGELRSRYPLPENFILYIGGAERRKNIATLVRAWKRIAPDMRRRGVKLLVVAHFPPADRLYPDVPRLARDLALEDIVFMDSVDEADKPALYRAATACCFPSVYEGFGFTPLESMASGTPLLASSASSIPEVVGDGGILLPPEDDAAWADALLEVVDSPPRRTELTARGLIQARQFSWRKTAEETVAVYREVLGA